MGKKQLSLLELGQYVATRPRPTDDELRGLIARIHPDFKPVWNGLPEDQQLALAAYFLPWGSKKELIGPTRPRVLHWYCPFAAQTIFPSGHRYCLNVYSGCSHECEYCYAVSYARSEASCKRGFERMLERDLADLETFDVPPAPVHLSNSTDRHCHWMASRAWPMLASPKHRPLPTWSSLWISPVKWESSMSSTRR